MDLEQNFSLTDLVSILGLAQCVLIFFYIAVQAGKLKQAVIPLTFFAILAGGFALQSTFINTVLEIDFWPRVLYWLAWALAPPLSYLLVLQLARPNTLPSLGDYWVFLPVLGAGFGALSLDTATDLCEVNFPCDRFYDWLYLFGVIAGAFCLLAIWLRRNLFEDLLRQPRGRERYWLVIALIIINALLLGINLLRSTPVLTVAEADIVRSGFGLAFVYLATTSILRIYPQPVQLTSAKWLEKDLSDNEQVIAEKISELMELDKVYQQAAFTRADLARELEVSENVLSRVINVYFEKSFPQLLNEHRVKEAKWLLGTSEAPINVIASEVGFNSLASFNRAFKDLEGCSPSQFRKADAKKKNSAKKA